MHTQTHRQFFCSMNLCVYNWGCKLRGSYLHPRTAIYLYTLTQGSILVPRSRSLAVLLMGTHQASIIMKPKEIALERQ